MRLTTFPILLIFIWSHGFAIARYGFEDDPILEGGRSGVNSPFGGSISSFGDENIRLSGGSSGHEGSLLGMFRKPITVDSSISQPIHFNFDNGGNDGFRFGGSSNGFGGGGTAQSQGMFSVDKSQVVMPELEEEEASVLQCPNGPATYSPGDLKVTLGGGLATSTLLASAGLNGRVLTLAEQNVLLNEGTSQSNVTMHSLADGAATVPDESHPNHYYLISNSETRSGGVGILHFDASKNPHDVIGYRRTAEHTPTGSGRNCGGGRTPWGTWLTSEESSGGSVYEIDPNDESGITDYCRVPIVPGNGGFYESNAYWKNQYDNKYHFYTTEDSDRNYRLTRFIPDDTIDTMLSKPRKLDRLCGASGSLSYLKLVCTSNCRSSTPSGTYFWSSSRVPDTSSDQPYPHAEGMDVKGNELYFVTKQQQRLYILDLSSNTWTSTGTIQSDTTTFSADQVARITGSNSPDDLLYFAEDGRNGGTQDIHARGLDRETGEYKFFTIIQGYDTTETTGLTFSPDNKYMYFAHQANSEIWQIWREDGCTFGNGIYLDVKYHEFVSRYLRQ